MRCFIAVDIPDQLKQKIIEVQKKLECEGIKPTEKENLHFTLKFLGEISNEQTEQVREKLKQVKIKPFRISINEVGVFPNLNYIKIVWLGCDSEELVELAKSVDKKMNEIRFEKNEKYQNHITIARVKAKPTKELIKKIQELKDIEIGEMLVDNIKLKASKLTSKGPIYTDLEIFELE